MAIIKIQTKKTGIPIEIGELKFTFEMDDSNIEKFFKTEEIIAENLKGLDEEKEDFVAESNRVLKHAYDQMLGAGSYEKIYEQTPSVLLLVDYLSQMTNGIADEITSLQIGIESKNKEKYLKKAKK